MEKSAHDWADMEISSNGLDWDTTATATDAATRRRSRDSAETIIVVDAAAATVWADAFIEAWSLVRLVIAP